MSTLHDLAVMGNIEGIFELIRNGANPNARDDKGNTPLHIVASEIEHTLEATESNFKVAEELIKFKADVNITNYHRRTPLMEAVRALKGSMVELLLNSGADINLRDLKLNTAIHHAVFNLHSTVLVEGLTSSELQVIETLLKFNPQLDIRNVFNETPLLIAVDCEELPVVQCLLKHNASVNIFDRHIETALHRVFRYEVDIDIVFEILRYGGDLSLRNKYGLTPLDMYLLNLNKHFSCEVKHAKSVFKIFILLQLNFSSPQQRVIIRMSDEHNCQLPQFIAECTDELNKMLRDELAPNYCVHKIFLRGFLKSAENEYVLDDVFDKVVDYVIKGEYSIYGDLILNGICSPYLNNKFAEICSVESVFGESFIFDVLYKLSFYLPRLEMLSMMVAFTAENKWDVTSDIWNTTRLLTAQ